MQRSFAVYLFFCCSSLLYSAPPSSFVQLTNCVHDSLNGDARSWVQGGAALAREKAVLCKKYHEALQLLGTWYEVGGEEEDKILDSVAACAGFTPSPQTRWQISALLVIALRGHRGVMTKKGDAFSSRLAGVWRFLKRSWYLLVIAALIAYYGWAWLKKLLPALAEMLKKLMSRVRSGSVSAPKNTAVAEEAYNDEQLPKRASRGNMPLPFIPHKSEACAPLPEPWLDAVPLYTPAPPADGPAGGAVSEGITLVRAWRVTCNVGESCGQWLDRNGSRVRICTGVLRDIGMGVGGFMVGIGQGAAKAACQQPPANEKREKEAFYNRVVPTQTRGFVPISTPETQASDNLQEATARVDSLSRVATVAAAVSAASAACGVCGAVYNKIREPEKITRCRCHHTDQSAADDHQQ